MDKLDNQLVYFNGSIVPYTDAGVQLMSPALKYGTAVYEGIRAYWEKSQEQLFVFRLQDHVHRLINSARTMRLQFDHDEEYLCQAVIDAIRANEARQDLHIRQCVFLDGTGSMGSVEPTGMYIVPVPSGRMMNTDGIHVGVSSWTRISDNSMPARVKCIANYQNGRLAQLQAKADGYDAPLLLNSLGKVTEAPTATFFLIRNGVPVTCPLTCGVLESITRESLIELLEENFQLNTEERVIDRTELYTAQEAFLCGTAAEITPVISIDRLPVGDGKPGPITTELRKKYLGIARGVDPQHAGWRTPVY